MATTYGIDTKELIDKLSAIGLNVISIETKEEGDSLPIVKLVASYTVGE